MPVFNHVLCAKCDPPPTQGWIWSKGANFVNLLLVKLARPSFLLKRRVWLPRNRQTSTYKIKYL
jgi:hypothetical protein